jgi:hypothetical protein
VGLGPSGRMVALFNLSLSYFLCVLSLGQFCNGEKRVSCREVVVM